MTTTTITAILATYGFETRWDGSMFWGVGSLVWGHTAIVEALGHDLYRVTTSHWFYDPDGNPLVDEGTTAVLHGALALARVFSEMPASFWRR